MARLSLLLLGVLLGGCGVLTMLFAPTGITGACLDDGWFALQYERGPEISLSASRGISSFIPTDVCKVEGPGVSCKPKSFPFVMNVKASGVVSTYPFSGLDPQARPETYSPQHHVCLKLPGS